MCVQFWVFAVVLYDCYKAGEAEGVNCLYQGVLYLLHLPNRYTYVHTVTENSAPIVALYGFA